jgi:hypothetical protein
MPIITANRIGPRKVALDFIPKMMMTMAARPSNVLTGDEFIAVVFISTTSSCVVRG